MMQNIRLFNVCEATRASQKHLKARASYHSVQVKDLHFNPYISAMTRDFRQCGILTSVDSDEPLQPPLILRHSKWCPVSSVTTIEYSSD